MERRNVVDGRRAFVCLAVAVLVGAAALKANLLLQLLHPEPETLVFSLYVGHEDLGLAL
jgi:hypothetical protein